MSSEGTMAGISEERRSSASSPAHFREVLGLYPTGVVVVTTYGVSGKALGMTLGSFTSVSLDPPIVGFMPRVESKSWKEILAAGKDLCVNILGSSQESVCRSVSTRASDKFDGITLSDSPAGNPIIQGALAYLDCKISDVFEAGDHFIVLATVENLSALEQGDSESPLLFYRGGYGSFTTRSLAAGGSGLLHELATVDVARPAIEALARSFDTEVSTMHLVDDGFVFSTSSGVAKTRVSPTRVGRRFPVAPPIGAVFAAWGNPSMRQHWMSSVTDAQQRRWLTELLDVVRDRGFNVNLGHAVGRELEGHLLATESDSRSAEAKIVELMRTAAGEFAPMRLMDSEKYELRNATAPVLDADGNVVFAITMWGPPGVIDGLELLQRTSALRETAARASETLRWARIAP